MVWCLTCWWNPCSCVAWFGCSCTWAPCFAFACSCVTWFGCSCTWAPCFAFACSCVAWFGQFTWTLCFACSCMWAPCFACSGVLGRLSLGNTCWHAQLQVPLPRTLWHLCALNLKWTFMSLVRWVINKSVRIWTKRRRNHPSDIPMRQGRKIKGIQPMPANG